MADERTWVVNNIRPGDLQKTIDRYKRDGWTLHSFAQAAGAGHIGVTFTAVFERGKNG